MAETPQSVPRDPAHAAAIAGVTHTLGIYVREALDRLYKETGHRIGFALCMLPMDSCEAAVLGNMPPHSLCYICEVSKVGLMRACEIQKPGMAKYIEDELNRSVPAALFDVHTMRTTDMPPLTRDAKPEAGELYCWIIRDASGKEGPLAFADPAVGMAPCITSRADLATGMMKDLAIRYAEETGTPVRLDHFKYVGTIDEVKP